MKSLMPDKHPVILLLTERLGGYVNGHQVEVCLHVDESISISCDYPRSGFPECTLFRHFPDFSSFQQVFPADHENDLDTISPEKCRLLYEKGQLSIHCVADLFLANALVFTREQEGLHAVDQGSGNGHMVLPPLASPHEYLHYTRQYFVDNQQRRHPGRSCRPPFS
jgi:hypothetical protein